MSHFAMLVIGGNIEEQLAPYVEEVDENSPYAEWRDTTQEYKRDYEGTTQVVLVPDGEGNFDTYLPWNEMFRTGGIGLGSDTHNGADNFEKMEIHNSEFHDTFESFIEWWTGSLYNEKEDGFGYYHNPNAKWDWYVVGGRWTGSLKLKDNVDNIEDIGLGRPGVFGNEPPVGYVDQARKKDIDFEGQRQDATEAAEKRYDAYASLFPNNTVPTNYVKWKTLLKDEGFSHMNIEHKRDFFHSQPAIVTIKEVNNSKYKEGSNLTEEQKEAISYTCMNVDAYAMPREQYIGNARNSATSFFGFVKDGEWIEKGNMGWWGCVSDEEDQDTWNEKFTEMLDNLPDDTLITVVDCHI